MIKKVTSLTYCRNGIYMLQSSSIVRKQNTRDFSRMIATKYNTMKPIYRNFIILFTFCLECVNTFILRI